MGSEFRGETMALSTSVSESIEEGFSPDDMSDGTSVGAEDSEESEEGWDDTIESRELLGTSRSSITSDLGETSVTALDVSQLLSLVWTRSVPNGLVLVKMFRGSGRALSPALYAMSNFCQIPIL